MVKLHVNKELLFYHRTGLANIWDYIIFLCLKSKPQIITHEMTISFCSAGHINYNDDDGVNWFKCRSQRWRLRSLIEVFREWLRRQFTPNYAGSKIWKFSAFWMVWICLCKEMEIIWDWECSLAKKGKLRIIQLFHIQLTGRQNRDYCCVVIWPFMY